jgi:hypothetical protein
MAQSGQCAAEFQCPLLGVRRTHIDITGVSDFSAWLPPPTPWPNWYRRFVVIDSAGQKLACVYFEDEPGRLSGGQVTHERRGAADERGEAAGAVGALMLDCRTTSLGPFL